MYRNSFAEISTFFKKHYSDVIKVILLLTQIFFVQISFASDAALNKVSVTHKKDLEPSSSDIIVGDMNAKDTVVEYFSLTCFHCAIFHEKFFPQIKKTFIDSGKVKWIQRPFVTDQRALNAGLLLECKKSNHEAYNKFLAILLAKQEVWATGKNYIDILKNIAKLSGMTKEQIDKCIGNTELAKQIAEESVKASKNLGVRATPSFFFNGVLVQDGLTAEKLQELISKRAKENE